WPGPRRTGHRYAGLVQTIDLFPTLLDAAGLPVPAEDGVDLRRLARGAGDAAGAGGRRAVFAEHSNGFGAMVRPAAYQYIVSRGNPLLFPDGPTLYDLHADPQEIHNLVGHGMAAESELAGLLDAWMAQRRPRPTTPGSPSQPQPQPLSAECATRPRTSGLPRA